MKLLIIGEDLVAWTLGAVLASTGCSVKMTAGALPDATSEEVEPDLSRLLTQQLESGRLQLGFNPVAESAVLDLLIDARDFVSTDSILDAVRLADFPPLIALVQPVPLGTTDQLQEALNKATPKPQQVVFWPNFIQAGRALESFTRVEQLLLGSASAQATNQIKRLMLPFNRSQERFRVMTPREAELTKLAINGMLATRISFMNELAQLAERQEIDIEAVRQGMGADSRIGFQYLYPGCGFGGEAFLQTLDQLNSELAASQSSAQHLLSSVQATNEQQKDLLFQKLWRFYKANLAGKRVAVWGCSFKPNAASISGSPAIHLIEALLAHNVDVVAYDPRALPAVKKHFAGRAGLSVADSPEAAAQGADAILLVTEWKEFWNLDLASIKEQMNLPLLLDGRNIYDPEELAAQGWVYSGVGRGQVV
ncbi:UDPglucose 6-dehydrogenase [Marinospirillum celere]|uniref:UDP-glucose 6-dehydrogenase n=1 Tax=Marinospirillum celere TaxID=1122252 RepID=A0A1I1E9X5_9GAMM|nr:nucleotide sugar dehydrogenase [Marinospirillum celere]SFB83915.1 UDPglucose 6-dehydrogenase [Marinospirillum celere]